MNELGTLMSTATVENVSSMMKTKPTGNDFMKYLALLIFFRRPVLWWSRTTPASS